MQTIVYNILLQSAKAPKRHNIVKILSKCSVNKWYIKKEANFVSAVEARVPLNF